ALSKARGDPFSIAIALAKSKATPQSSEGSATSGPLGALKGVLGLDEAELATMGLLDDSDPDLPVVVPSCAEDARRSVDRLQTTDPTQLAGFLASVATLEKTLGAIMPAGTCSPTAPTTQLVAALNDLLAVDQAFAIIRGVPSQVSASVKQAVAHIKELQAKVAA